MKNSSGEVIKEQLIADFNAVAADAEALLKATANQGGEKLAEVRARAEASLNHAKVRMAKAQGALLVKTRSAGKVGDEFVHEHPWKTAGAAAGLALVIGLLIGRR